MIIYSFPSIKSFLKWEKFFISRRRLIITSVRSNGYNETHSLSRFNFMSCSDIFKLDLESLRDFIFIYILEIDEVFVKSSFKVLFDGSSYIIPSTLTYLCLKLSSDLLFPTSVFYKPRRRLSWSVKSTLSIAIEQARQVRSELPKEQSLNRFKNEYQKALLSVACTGLLKMSESCLSDEERSYLRDSIKKKKNEYEYAAIN